MASPGSKSRLPSGKMQEKKKPSKREFSPDKMDRTVIAIPLLEKLRAADEAAKSVPRKVFDVIIDLNLDYQGGRDKALERVTILIETALRSREKSTTQQGVSAASTENSQYVFASLDAKAIREIVRRDGWHGPKPASHAQRAIYHVWPDFELRALINKSIATVKADAAQNAFGAVGESIVWAVVDSGIDGTHPHFRMHGNLTLEAPLQHRDFTSGSGDPLVDVFGHGTHVAGIIAGEVTRGRIHATKRHRNEEDDPIDVVEKLSSIAGMAPRCKLLSLKVLNRDGQGNGAGKASNIMAAIQYIQTLNGYGRRIRVHGVNLSVGYEFDPEWFACGQSPLCVEVDRLVHSGVVVVIAAGNSGFGVAQSEMQGLVTAGLDLTINDPGNAALALTVGATHRDMPHVYGVSYFSSKGPTGDGRMKPDLVAPGEKIVSCDSSQRESAPGVQRSRRKQARRPAFVARYREESGTSMAAPHVSGVIAGFLSIRREFIGRPEEVKRIFLAAATDLRRSPHFQGTGVVDAMRAIQSV